MGVSTPSTQLPIPFDGIEYRPTIAAVRGDQHVHQCGWCGTVVIVPSEQPSIRGKACPSCDQTRHGWWKAHIGSGGIAGWYPIEETP